MNDERRGLLFTAIISFLLVAALFGPIFGETGFWQESGMPWLSDTRSWWEGFFYIGPVIGDPLRILTSVPFHLGSLVSATLGIPGSFLGYELVFCLLWIARGVLVYALVALLFRGEILLAMLCAVAAVVHAGDILMLKIAFLHQMATPVWMLAALVCLAGAWRWDRGSARIALAVAAGFFALLALFSYEAAYPWLLAGPVLMFLIVRPAPLVGLGTSFPLYLSAAAFTYQAVNRYLLEGGKGYGSYQASTLSGFELGAYLEAFAAQMGQALFFWQWPRNWSFLPPTLTLVAGGIAVVILIFGAWQLLPPSDRKRSFRQAVTALAFGLLGTAAGLGVTSMMMLKAPWRTQMIAYPMAGIAIGAALMLIVLIFAQRRTFALGLVGLFGVSLIATAAIRTEPLRQVAAAEWQLQREAMSQITTLVPDVHDGTLLLLVLPTDRRAIDNNPFADLNIWFDFPIRSAYRKREVAGALAFEDQNLEILDWESDSDRLRFLGRNTKPMFPEATVDELVVLRMDASGRISIEETLPMTFTSAGVEAAPYAPYDRISGAEQLPRNRNRFGPADNASP